MQALFVWNDLIHIKLWAVLNANSRVGNAWLVASFAHLIRYPVHSLLQRLIVILGLLRSNGLGFESNLALWFLCLTLLLLLRLGRKLILGLLDKRRLLSYVRRMIVVKPIVYRNWSVLTDGPFVDMGTCHFTNMVFYFVFVFLLSSLHSCSFHMETILDVNGLISCL